MECACLFRNLFRRKAPTETPSRSDSYGRFWLEALGAGFGEVTTIRKVQCANKPIIYTFHFDELLEKGGLPHGRDMWRLKLPGAPLTLDIHLAQESREVEDQVPVFPE